VRIEIRNRCVMKVDSKAPTPCALLTFRLWCPSSSPPEGQYFTSLRTHIPQFPFTKTVLFFSRTWQPGAGTWEICFQRKQLRVWSARFKFVGPAFFLRKWKPIRPGYQPSPGGDWLTADYKYSTRSFSPAATFTTGSTRNCAWRGENIPVISLHGRVNFCPEWLLQDADWLDRCPITPFILVLPSSG